MDAFENFGIAMVRGFNLLIFILINLAGVAIGFTDLHTPGGLPGLLGFIAVISALLISGLITGGVSLMLQMHAELVRTREQLEVIKADRE